MIDLETDTLQDFIKEHDQVIVQYGAGWCGNCRIIKPKFRKLSEENQSIQFVYADAEKLPGTRELAEIKNLPTFAAFKGGKLIKQTEGNKVEKIQELIDEIANH
ncbi:MAG: thiol reductase thioredoxin [Bdellovibrionaceae bacterium]|nr:thiol reductase thioredoxin [Pseudobdellovibrionaceae bacterium]|tara:strand:+ start:144 stop:455 length:312 start_codon:yes stop_codon:yes gene_type:complete